jgi:ABC-2 type transport system permease protein
MLLALMKKEILALLRDVHGLAALLLMPVLFIVIMSLALKDVYNPPTTSLKYAVESKDAGNFAKTLLEQWRKDHGQAQALPSDWQQALVTGKLKYVIQLDANTSDALAQTAVSDASATLTSPIHLLVEPSMDKALLASLLAQLNGLAAGIQTQTLRTVIGTLTHAKTDAPAQITNVLVDVKRSSATQMTPSSVQQNVPAWLVFGMFFVMSAMSGLWLIERQNGVIARLRSFGVSNVTMLLSKIIPYLGVNAMQAVLMLSVGVWLMPLLGADALQLQGIHWTALVLVIASISIAAVGLALLVACLVRTQAQAGAVVPILNVLMAAIGGIMVPKFVMPTFMQRLAEISPMNWGLEGLLTVLLRNGDLVAVMPYVIKLAGFAGLMFLLALFLLKRRTEV